MNNTPDSRYYGVGTVFIDGTETLDVRSRSMPSRYVFRKYRYREDERLDHLAYRFFGDEERWWALADTNDNLYPVPKSGSSIRVPR